MLGIVSSCAIVTLSLICTSLPIFDFKKCRDLEIGVRGQRLLKVTESSMQYTVTLKPGLWVTQGHRK